MGLIIKHTHEAVERALAAAETITAGHDMTSKGRGKAPKPGEVTLEDVMRSTGLQERILREALAVVRHGTEEEKAQAHLPSTLSLHRLRRQITQRRYGNRYKGKVHEVQSVQAEVARQLIEALNNLATMPAMEDVISSVSPAKRAAAVEAKLSAALNWLEGFRHAWTKTRGSNAKIESK